MIEDPLNGLSRADREITERLINDPINTTWGCSGVERFFGKCDREPESGGIYCGRCVRARDNFCK